MDMTIYITAFITLFVIIDPLGLLPIFIALTSGLTNAERRAIAIRGSLIGFTILSLFAFLGETVLEQVGISMPAFRIAGGILLFLTALDMLFERRREKREDNLEDKPDPSVFPVAMPLLAGPGSITTVILLKDELEGHGGVFSVLGVAAIVVLIAFTLMLAGGHIERALGKTGIKVVTRLLGMLLSALAIQFVLDGLKDFGFVS